MRSGYFSLYKSAGNLLTNKKEAGFGAASCEEIARAALLLPRFVSEQPAYHPFQKHRIGEITVFAAPELLCGAQRYGQNQFAGCYSLPVFV